MIDDISLPMSRRDVLRLGAAGAAAAAAAPLGLSSVARAGVLGESAAALRAFDPHLPIGKIPTKLPKRLALSNALSSSLFVNVAKYMQEACEDRGIGFVTAVYNLDPATQVSQTNGFFQRGIGCLVEEPVNLTASNPQMMRAIKAGILSVGVQRPDSHLQVSINQYGTGYGQGIAAVDWIKKNLRGQAQVVFFNNNNQSAVIQARDHGVLAALKTGGSGVQVVENITLPTTTSAVASTLTTILQAHPGVNVVLGAGSNMLGALSCFQALGRGTDPKVYVSSTAGSSADYAAIAGGSVYRATSAEPWNLWSYCIGQFAADWLEGKSIPRGIGAGSFKQKGLEPMLTTIPQVKAFAAHMNNPRKLWNHKSELAKFVSFFGNISYSTRGDWWRQTWNP